MKVSIILTTYNRALQLRRGINTIMKQTRLPDEIVVVDDGSSDNTQQTVENFYGMGVDIKYVYVGHPAPRISCIPRNIGIKKATGDVIIFTEPEALQFRTNIEELLKKMEQYPNNTILASQAWTMGERIFKKLDESYFDNPQRLIEHPFAMLTDAKHPSNTIAPDSDWGITGEAHCNAGILFACRKEWLLDVGGFNEEFEGHGFDDFDLFNRLAIYGKGIVKCPDIPVVHQYHDKSFYNYNIYEAANKNGKISEEMINNNLYKVNIDKEWGKI